MRARLEANNQAILPKVVVSAFEGTEYFRREEKGRMAMTEDKGRMVLTPVSVPSLDAVWLQSEKIAK